MDDSKIEFWSGFGADQMRALKIVNWSVNELGSPDYLEGSGVNPVTGPYLAQHPTDLLGPILGTTLKAGSEKLHSDMYFLNTANLSNPFYENGIAANLKPKVEKSVFPEGDIAKHILDFTKPELLSGWLRLLISGLRNL